MKKPLKIILLLAGACVLAAPVVRAEDPAPPAAPPADHPDRGPGRRNPGAMMERIAKELGLSADQEAKWKEIGQQERAAVEPIWSDQSLSRDEKRAKMKEINATYAEQRRAILTPDQQAKFDELRAKMKEHGPRKPKDE
jgi:Spy/CpxP family protein refolding chaperone